MNELKGKKYVTDVDRGWYTALFEAFSAHALVNLDLTWNVVKRLNEKSQNCELRNSESDLSSSCSDHENSSDPQNCQSFKNNLKFSKCHGIEGPNHSDPIINEIPPHVISTESDENIQVEYILYYAIIGMSLQWYFWISDY